MEPLLGKKEKHNAPKGKGAGISVINDGYTSEEGSGGEDLAKISLGLKSVSSLRVRVQMVAQKI